MLSRMSQVDHLTINSVSSSSVCQIGDSTQIVLKTRALAIKREFPFFYGREGNFDDYDVFNEPIPQPLIEAVNMQVTNLAPIIKVNRINIKGCSFSSIIHIGSTCTLDAESRIKHIRQLDGIESKTPDVGLEKELNMTADDVETTLEEDSTG
ncbi:spore germination protein GerPE [Priestia flexa]|uniref:spore germination protein GerPE n=1 Tax=Priestia flexa TaxID=86664 RepID=UPI0032EF476F